MSSNGPFGFDPEEFDRVFREAGEGLRDALEKIKNLPGVNGPISYSAQAWIRRGRPSASRTSPSPWPVC